MEDNNFVFLSIPIIWKDIYNELIKLMSNFGIDIIKDCSAICSNNGKNIITCWMTFNVACAAYAINNLKEVKILIIILIDTLNRNYGTNYDPDDYINFNNEDDLEFDENIFKVIEDNSGILGYSFDENVFTTQGEGNTYEFDISIFNQN